MTERDLMERIHRELHPRLHQETRLTPFSPALLAALVANESSARPQAERFEKRVFVRICLAAAGLQKFRDPSLSRQIEQKEWLMDADHAIANASHHGYFSLIQLGLDHYKKLATSYGYTQIMGWHALEWHWPLVELLDPTRHFGFVLTLLHWFTEHYQLDPAADADKLLRCWNTGRPDGKTYDPKYVPNGLRRMRLYQEVTTTSEATP